MDDVPALAPAVTEPSAAPLAPLPLPRWFAALQVVMVCGVPTQLLVLFVLFIAGAPLPVDGRVPLELFATLSLFDTALVAVLIRIFIALSGETTQAVFLGTRPPAGEFWRGLAMLPLVLVGITGLVFVLRLVFPWLHTVAESPLAAYMDTPLDTAIFAGVVILAGGVREELQRSFILHRFSQRLGGATVGLVVFSLVFGALHFTQGLDVAVAVGLLGLFWGILYLRRGSVVAPMVNHAGFDAAQVLQQVIVKAFAL